MSVATEIVLAYNKLYAQHKLLYQQLAALTPSTPRAVSPQTLSPLEVVVGTILLKARGGGWCVLSAKNARE